MKSGIHNMLKGAKGIIRLFPSPAEETFPELFLRKTRVSDSKTVAGDMMKVGQAFAISIERVMGIKYESLIPPSKNKKERNTRRKTRIV